MGSSVRARVLGGPGIVGLAARAAHDLGRVEDGARDLVVGEVGRAVRAQLGHARERRPGPERDDRDRKSTRLNSSHSQISYAVFCLKKKKNTPPGAPPTGSPGE